MLVIAYAMALLVVGRRLDHSVPFEWRSRSPRNDTLDASPERPVPAHRDGIR
jgi:hypothetical protein